MRPGGRSERPAREDTTSPAQGSGQVVQPEEWRSRRYLGQLSAPRRSGILEGASAVFRSLSMYLQRTRSFRAIWRAPPRRTRRSIARSEQRPLLAA